MAGVFDHLHIKRHTAGSSNELSFDVLDNARSGLDERASISHRLPKPPKPAKGNYRGIKDTTTLGGNEEVKRRKKARRLHAVRLWLVAVLVALLASFALLWYGYRHYLEVQDFSTRFDALINQFVEEDAFLAEVDALMAKLDDASTAEKRAQAGAKIPDIIGDVQRISGNARTAKPLAVDDQDEIVIATIIETSDGRVQMLEAAQMAFDQAAARDKRLETGAAIWNEVVEEGQQAKEVSEQANRATTEEQTIAARDKTKQLLEKVEASSSRLREFAAESPQVDVAAQLSYLETKMESLRYAVETGDALVEGDRELAATKNEAYNTADQTAAAQAKDLPPSVEDAVRTAYEAELAASLERYEQARNAVIASDALIRDYLESHT